MVMRRLNGKRREQPQALVPGPGPGPVPQIELPSQHAKGQEPVPPLCAAFAARTASS